MADPVRRRASYEDVLAAPPHQIAEVIDGELRLQPRPAKPHGAAASALGGGILPPFQWGRGGPGGWFILDEPELHLRDDILAQPRFEHQRPRPGARGEPGGGCDRRRGLRITRTGHRELDARPQAGRLAAQAAASASTSASWRHSPGDQRCNSTVTPARRSPTRRADASSASP